MAIALEPVILDSPFGDGEARLALRDGRLIAILSCLGELHGELRGRWFVEAAFGEHPVPIGRIFGSLADFEAQMAAAPDAAS